MLREMRKVHSEDLDFRRVDFSLVREVVGKNLCEAKGEEDPIRADLQLKSA